MIWYAVHLITSRGNTALQHIRGDMMTINEKHTHLQHAVEYCKLALWMLLMCSPAFVIALSVTDRF